jgi:tRNA threonylcarbamoyladenosine biosynthesis protein TsaB
MMIEEALQEARLERGQIEGLVVGIGPGSYTGIRAAIALAQGWQLARDVKLLGISSAECIAAQARAEGFSGWVKVVIDAQRDEFYLADYELTPEKWTETKPLRLATMAEVQPADQAEGLIIGPEVTKWFSSGKAVFPRAAKLGELAAGRTDFVPGQKLEPIYLRETQFVKAPPPRIWSA